MAEFESKTPEQTIEAPKASPTAEEVVQKTAEQAGDLKDGVETNLNKPIEPLLPEEAPKEEIKLEAVKSLMTKGNSALNDEEATLLSQYYSQEAEKAQNKGETFMAIMMHLRALLASLKLDFLSAPEDATKEDKDGKPQVAGAEHTLTAPSKDEKPTASEELAKTVETAKNVPALVLLTVASKEGKESTEANLAIIADDIIAKLGKEKPSKTDPVKYILAYIKAKLAPSTDSKLIASEFAKYHVKVNSMYANKEISYNSYYTWTTHAQGTKEVASAVGFENVKPGTLYNMLSAKWRSKHGKRLSPDKIANVNTIERMVLAAGYSIRIAAAMLANAWHESGWKADIKGDRGNSIGLFQLHINGAGHGMTVAERQDPVQNTKRILEIMEKTRISWNGKKTFREADAAGASIKDLTNLFCYYIERPKARDTSRHTRATAAERMFETNLG